MGEWLPLKSLSNRLTLFFQKYALCMQREQMCNSKEMRAQTRHCNFVAGHSVYTLETITSMVLLYGEPVCALQMKMLFFNFFWKTASIFGERGNFSIVCYDFCTWKYYLKTALFRFKSSYRTQGRECDIVKGCRVSKIIQCAAVNCPRQYLETRERNRVQKSHQLVHARG